MTPNATDSSPALVAIDWGTSSFRAWLLDADGNALDSVQDDLGILKVPSGNFEAVFDDQLCPWFEKHGPLPALASGMIGSRQGWVEAPYVACPAGPKELADHLAVVRTSSSITLHIVPGMNYSDEGVPDVMRGEETQVAGAIADWQLSKVCVLPGTHSKWMLVRDGCIQQFKTFMTGELFSLLVEYSILGRLMEGREFDDAAFERGCRIVMESEGELLSQLFSARTLGLFEQLPLTGIHSYLSGLIICSEIREGLAKFPQLNEAQARPVKLIGDETLLRLYQRAFDLTKSKSELVKGHPVTWGLFEIARAASLIA